MNKFGPRWDPCGTPEVVMMLFDMFPNFYNLHPISKIWEDPVKGRRPNTQIKQLQF